MAYELTIGTEIGDGGLGLMAVILHYTCLRSILCSALMKPKDHKRLLYFTNLVAFGVTYVMVVEVKPILSALEVPRAYRENSNCATLRGCCVPVPIGYQVTNNQLYT